MTTVLTGLPEQVDAALLVLVHQEPDRVSQLPELLARSGPLPARHAEGGEALMPGQVLVAPPGRHLLVTPQRRTALLVSGDFPPNRPSADLLLVSMAARGDAVDETLPVERLGTRISQLVRPLAI